MSDNPTSLYEQLIESRRKQEQDLEEFMRKKNAIKTLDEDEAEFLEDLALKKRMLEDNARAEDAAQLKIFKDRATEIDSVKAREAKSLLVASKVKVPTTAGLKKQKDIGVTLVVKKRTANQSDKKQKTTIPKKKALVGAYSDSE